MKSKYDVNDIEDLYSDCFAKTRMGCTALTEECCKLYGECKFYKPKEVSQEQLKRMIEIKIRKSY